MELTVVMRYGLVVVGLALLISSFWFHATKRMISDLAAAWCLLGFVLIVVGTVPTLSMWIDRISGWTGIALFVVGAACLGGAFRICLVISRLTTQNQELAMLVSLLLEENAKRTEAETEKEYE